jgi:DNA repair protein RadC
MRRRRATPPHPRTQPSLIAEIPHDERPRERLLRNGAQALSDAELVAILLKGGRPGASVLDLSRELLFQAGGLRGLANSCAKSLRRNGVGEVRIATLLAAVEIACRMAAAAVPTREPLSRPAEVSRYIDLRYGRSGQEVMGALYVCARHRLIGERELYRGTIHRAAVEPRAILREGLLLGAAGILLFHTHPSGDPAPSREDLLFTRRMARAGEVVGIELVDHLIVGAGGAWVSVKERGGW